MESFRNFESLDAKKKPTTQQKTNYFSLSQNKNVDLPEIVLFLPSQEIQH